ncbi:MAG: hypothetical protein ACTSPN_13000 [Promethearchaeota archaeon]
MKKKRKIVLHDPRLRNIRTQMRLLLTKVVSEEIIRLNSTCSDLIFKGEVFEKYHLKAEKLAHQFEHLVARCCMCRRSDLDMIFNPIGEEWACDECVEVFKESYDDVIALHKEGKSIGDFNIDYMEGFLDNKYLIPH